MGVAVRADPADQKLLLEIQAADVLLRQIQAKLAQLPADADVARLSEELQQTRSAMRQSLTQVDSLRLELERAESDVAMVEARIAKDTERVDHTSSAKDAQGLQHELQTLRERLSTLEEVELEVMERLETAQADLDAQESAAEALEQQLHEASRVAQSEREALEAERTSASTARAEVATRVPEDLLALYERQRERYGYGASLLRAGVSGASGVMLTESDLAMIRQAAPDEVVLCPDSNAILIRTEESGLSG